MHQYTQLTLLLFFFFFFTFIVCVVCLHACVIKRQIKEVSSLHPQYVFQELNLSHLAWWQGLLCAEL